RRLRRRFPTSCFFSIRLLLAHPKLFTGVESFAFPEWRAGFKRVDNKFACPKCLPAMNTCNANIDNLFFVVEFPNAMNDSAAKDVPAPHCSITYLFQFALAHPRIVIKK